MRAIDGWTAFLAMLFLILGLCGLFASYAAPVPLERALARNAMLDGLQRSGAGTAELEAMRPALGDLAPTLLADCPISERIGRARAMIADEARHEAASVGYRARLMVVVVMVLCAGLGTGILAIARRSVPARPLPEDAAIDRPSAASPRG